jgi:hypothetical protein
MAANDAVYRAPRNRKMDGSPWPVGTVNTQ